MNTTISSRTFTLPLQFAGTISALAFSPDSTRLAVVSSRGSLAIWETRTGACVFAKQITRDRLTALAWTRQGKCVLLGGQRGILSLLHLASGEAVTSASFSHPITKIAYAPNEEIERFLVMAGPILQVFTAGQPHGVTRRYPTPLVDAAWCPAGRDLALLTQHGLVDVWEVASRSTRLRAILPNTPRCLTWGATDQELIIGTHAGTIQDYSLRKAYWGNEHPISRFPLAALFRGEAGLIAQSACETVLWTSQALQALAQRVQALALDPCGTTLATAHAGAIQIAPLPTLSYIGG
jgi:WD40 repeat protein